VIVGTASGVGATVAERLRARGDAAAVVSDQTTLGIAEAIERAQSDPIRPLRGVVLLSALDDPRHPEDADATEVFRPAIAGLLEIVRNPARRQAGVFDS
jgi:NAD(P)-dependent dehydrogenase (short-subunit alcohol dehydrogenase family)